VTEPNDETLWTGSDLKKSSLFYLWVFNPISYPEQP